MKGAGNTISNEIIEKVKDEILKLRKFRNLVSDTRQTEVSLYDHLVLTGGIAVSMIKELLSRNVQPYTIVGLDTEVSDEKLINLTYITGILHDIGKIKSYRDHINNGIRIIEERNLLAEIEEKYRNIILEGIKRHHKRENPKTIFQKVICVADNYASGGDRWSVEETLEKRKNFEEWYEAIKSTILFETEIFGDKKPLALLYGDVDGIKSYVYETSKLPEIRGASELLNLLNTDLLSHIFEKNGLKKECIVYKGGGGFLAIVPDSLKQKLKKDIEKKYLEKTLVCSISVVYSKLMGYVEFTSGKNLHTEDKFKGYEDVKETAKWLIKSYLNNSKITERKNFADNVIFLTQKVREKKMMKEYIPFYPSIPIMKRYEHCGKRPSVKVISEGEEVYAVCEVCIRKYEYSERYLFFEKFKNRMIGNNI